MKPSGGTIQQFANAPFPRKSGARHALSAGSKAGRGVRCGLPGLGRVFGQYGIARAIRTIWIAIVWS